MMIFKKRGFDYEVTDKKIHFSWTDNFYRHLIIKSINRGGTKFQCREGHLSTSEVWLEVQQADEGIPPNQHELLDK